MVSDIDKCISDINKRNKNEKVKNIKSVENLILEKDDRKMDKIKMTMIGGISVI